MNIHVVSTFPGPYLLVSARLASSVNLNYICQTSWNGLKHHKGPESINYIKVKYGGVGGGGGRFTAATQH